jgi:hypothetical protein
MYEADLGWSAMLLPIAYFWSTNAFKNNIAGASI